MTNTQQQTTTVETPPQPIMVAPEGKGFYVFHITLKWDVAGPFRLRQDAMAEVKKRKKAAGVESWGVQLKPLKHPKDQRDPLLMFATEQLAALLQETKQDPIEAITCIIKVCGLAFAEAVYKETMEIEAKGGMLVNGKQENRRARTRGGIFFRLARGKMTEQQRDLVPAWKKHKDLQRKFFQRRNLEMAQKAAELAQGAVAGSQPPTKD